MSNKEKSVIEIINLTKKYQLDQFNHKTLFLDIINFIRKKQAIKKMKLKL